VHGLVASYDIRPGDRVGLFYPSGTHTGNIIAHEHSTCLMFMTPCERLQAVELVSPSAVEAVIVDIC